jgi:hypothetical protein|tara:strand:+ start:628 stop:822 length:195 start_codon:yes stop_codon:yes gene_type:complete
MSDVEKNEKRWALKINIPVDSEADRLIREIDEVQTQLFGKPLPRHAYLVRGLKHIKEYYSQIQD